MQYTPQLVSAAEIEGPRSEAENDDIDRLFGKLQKVQPPESLVSNILSSISRLPKDVHTRQDVSDLNLADYIEKRAGWEDIEQYLDGPVVKKHSKGAN